MPMLKRADYFKRRNADSMKKANTHRKPGLKCEDDALEVKNAMLITALLAEEQNNQSGVEDPLKKGQKS
jgi:hypothetical protein